MGGQFHRRLHELVFRPTQLEMEMNCEIGGGAFGGPTAGFDQPNAKWQDPMLFTQTAPGFIIEIAPTPTAG